MVQHPESFEKAQKEMVDVVGDGRLPSFDDQASLPYLACIIREVYRCECVYFSSPNQLTSVSTMTDGVLPLRVGTPHNGISGY